MRTNNRRSAKVPVNILEGLYLLIWRTEGVSLETLSHVQMLGIQIKEFFIWQNLQAWEGSMGRHLNENAHFLSDTIFAATRQSSKQQTLLAKIANR